MLGKSENRITYLARTNFRNEAKAFGIKKPDRRAHMYVIGKTGTGKSTFLETLIRQDIDAGILSPMALIRIKSHDPFDMGHNHQVLAYGYELESELSGMLYVYDMNCPGVGQTMAFDLRGDRLTAVESCPREGNPLRGFFCEIYVPGTPPSIA